MSIKKMLPTLCLAFALHHLSIAQLRSGDDVVINEAVTRDLYVAGGTVTINAPIQGDLVAAGGTIIVNDTVTQDILVVGGNVFLNGFVGDDVRCGGGTIKLNGIVQGDFVGAGGSIFIDKAARISGDLLSSGGEVTMNGDVEGDIRSASGMFTLNGVAKQTLEARGGEIVINGRVTGRAIMAAEAIGIGSDAKFGSDVTYWNKAGTLDFDNTMQRGSATYDPALEIEDGKLHYLGFASFLMVLWYLGTAFVMIVLIQYLFRITLKNAANTVKNASVKSLGVGFLFLIGVPIAIMILFVTVIGIPIGILSLISYLTIILLATVIVAVLISNWINNTYYQSSWKNGRIMVVAFGLFVLLKLVSLTPFIGPLLMLLLACMGFGGILLNIKLKKDRALALT